MSKLHIYEIVGAGKSIDVCVCVSCFDVCKENTSK